MVVKTLSSIVTKNIKLDLPNSKIILPLPNDLVFIMDVKDNFFANSVDIEDGLGHESDLIRKMMKFIKPGEVFVEVGANYGDFSLQMSKYIGNEGKVYAFEPGTNTFKCLRSSIFLNGLTNIILENKAVLDEEKEIYFRETIQDDVNGSLGSYVSTAKTDNNTISVQAITLDNYFNSQKIHVLRLDAEGSECKVLKGAQKIIDFSSNIIIFIEWQKNLLDKYESDHSLQSCLGYLEKQGFIFLNTNELDDDCHYALYQVYPRNFIMSNHFEFLAIRKETLAKFIQREDGIPTKSECQIKANEFLYSATISNDTEALKLALSQGAEVNKIHPIGATTLYMAVQENFFDIAKLLLEYGADPNIKAINGYTALYESVINNNYNIAKLLLEFGADTECFVKIGMTALYMAALQGNEELITLLLDYGASRNTAYVLEHVAALGKNDKAIQLLAEKKSNFYNFDKDGIEEIALIEMVKNEEDIIFENLVWHFAVGFRKFIITDNISIDKTREQIKKFVQLTENYAKVFIIEDPIVEYIQSKITTGMYNFARSIWPEVRWIFPADGDEFWSAKVPLSEIIQNIPRDIDAIEVLAQRYEPSFDYYDFKNDTKFYERVHYRSYEVNHLHKIAVRAQDCITISQGNHYINIAENCSYKTEKNILSGNCLGLEMYEFRIRSVNQVHEKYYHSRYANLLAKEQGLLSKEIGAHWDVYADYIDKYGDKAGEIKFNQSFVNLAYAIDDPLPIERAIEAFYEIIGNQTVDICL